MRGLEERIAYAKEKVAQSIFPSADGDEMHSIFHDATAQGICDYRKGIFDAPGMYRDVPLLLEGWNKGQEFASDLEEMANCSGCQESHGDPCPIHG